MKKRVLVVDDTPAHQQLMRGSLESMGFEVAVADGGENFERHLADLNPALVVMDIRLPGMSGLHLIRQMKNDPRHQGIPALVVTALAFKPTDHDVVASGCDAFLEKPLKPETFIKTVSTLVPR
jgi:two-component system cell cycle response regulator DivK